METSDNWRRLLDELNAKAESTRVRDRVETSGGESSSEGEEAEEAVSAGEEEEAPVAPKSRVRVPKVDLAQTKASLSSLRAKLDKKVEKVSAVDKTQKKRKSQKRELRCAVNRRVTDAGEDEHEARLRATAARGVVKFLDCVVQAQKAT